MNIKRRLSELQAYRFRGIKIWLIYIAFSLAVIVMFITDNPAELLRLGTTESSPSSVEPEPSRVHDTGTEEDAVTGKKLIQMRLQE